MKKDTLGGNRMKAIAIVEVPEGGKGKWYINGEIRYTEYRPLIQKFDIQMIPLKPLPQKFRTDGDDIEEDSYWNGWNACIDEITGEKE